MKKVPFIIALFIFNWCMGQPVSVKDYAHSREMPIVKEFMDLLAIPNVAADTVNIRKNAVFIMDMMMNRGIQHVQLLSSSSSEVPPVIYGDVMVKGATQTLIFYAHYDGQPVNPSQWAKVLSPFTPKLFSAPINEGGTEVPLTGNSFNPGWRIYARGASDDKAGVVAILNAFEAVIEAGKKPAFNLKFFFEGEEEAGSPHLAEILQKYKPLLQSDLWIICDGPVHQSGKKQIVFGVRGDCHLDLTVYGSKRPLHSGHYGNWAPNPAMMLSKLLASMKNDSGKVIIRGFYNDVAPLGIAEKKALQQIPPVDEQMKSELGLSALETPELTLSEAVNLPSLNINGMQSGNVGKMASNQVPTYATAVLDLRLVLGNDWQKQQQKVIDHIKLQGYHVIGREPTDEERMRYGKLIRVIAGNDGYNAQRTPMDLPVAKKIINAVQNTSAVPLVLQPTSGGSLPLFLFEKYLGAKTISVPIANHDNNQHAENENIKLKNLFEGIETMAAIMLMQ